MWLKVLLVGIIVLIISGYIVFTGRLVGISTEYTTGFSQEKFALIEIGMSRQKVLEILDKPFSEADTQLNCDGFSKTKSNLSDYLGWKAVYVCYDAKGNVIDKAENIFFN